MDLARSVNGVPIRLTHERWYHTVENHDEMSGFFHDVLEAVESPHFVVHGNSHAQSHARSRQAEMADCGVSQIVEEGWVCHHSVLPERQAQEKNRMAETIASTTQHLVATSSALAGEMLRLPSGHVWIDYDTEADVLYMSFRKPQCSTRTIELDEDTLIRKDGSKVVGVTFMNASTRRGSSHASRK